MAYLAQDDKQKTEQDLQGQNQPQLNTVGSGESGGFVGGGAAGTKQGAVVGAGGQGAFTNIQSYLNANKGNAGVADYLKKTVGGTFDAEKGAVAEQSNKLKSKADDEVKSKTVGIDQASQLVQQAGQGNTSGLATLQGGVNAQYAGPQNFTYGLSDQAQNYGQGLSSKDKSAKEGFMQNIYNQAAGGQLGAGQLALQRQLDQGNEALAKTQDELANQFSQLNPYIQDQITQTNQYFGNKKNELESNKSQLKTYLESQSAANKKQIEDAAKAFNEAEQKQAEGHTGYVNRYYVNDGNAFTPEMVKKLNEAAQAQVGFRASDPFQILLNQLNAPMQYSAVGVDRSKMYNRGGQANLENIGGVDPQRNSYNFLQQSLGGMDKINDAADVTHGGLNSDLNTLFDTGREAIDPAENTMNQWKLAGENAFTAPDRESAANPQQQQTGFEFINNYLAGLGLNQNAISRLAPKFRNLGGRWAN